MDASSIDGRDNIVSDGIQFPGGIYDVWGVRARSDIWHASSGIKIPVKWRLVRIIGWIC